MFVFAWTDSSFSLPIQPLIRVRDIHSIDMLSRRMMEGHPRIKQTQRLSLDKLRDKNVVSSRFFAVLGEA
jgi:hypothetical protein